MTKQDKARKRKASQDKTRQNKARQSKAGQNITSGKTKYKKARASHLKKKMRVLHRFFLNTLAFFRIRVEDGWWERFQTQRTDTIAKDQARHDQTREVCCKRGDTGKLK
jgi:hypothetical protein